MQSNNPKEKQKPTKVQMTTPETQQRQRQTDKD